MEAERQLNPCPMCKGTNIIATYENDWRYRYYCKNCGQYIELNAPTQMAADLIYNSIIAKEGDEV